MKEELTELLTYLVTSSAGLASEPDFYGQIRLTEAAYRVARLLYEVEGVETLKPFIDFLKQNKGKSMTDLPAFKQMVQDSVLILLDCI